jgi:hypothetical protein
VYYSVQNSTGGTLPLYYDATNVSNMRTTDGSGFLYLSGVQYPYKWFAGGGPGNSTGPQILIDSKGIQYVNPWGGPTSIVDPDNNTISINGQQYTDSVGRTVPAVPQATSSIAGCPNLNTLYPNLGVNYQPAASSAQWTVPGSGPNANSTVTYTICYANIYYHTYFYNGGACTYQYYDGQENQENSYSDSWGTVPAIQSIVLPDGSFWGFVYDAGNEATITSWNFDNVCNLPVANDYSYIGYGTIKAVTLPEGGAITYSYIQEDSGCSPGPGGVGAVLSLSGRTVSDANGNNYQWQYGGAASPLGFTSSLVTDPNGNDTEYQYRIAPWAGNNGCAPLIEASRTQYRGSYSSGTPLVTTATNYSLVAAPQAGGDTSFPGFGNALPQTQTTTPRDVGLSTTTTTNSYAGSFSARVPACGLYYNAGTNQWSCPDVPSNVQMRLNAPFVDLHHRPGHRLYPAGRFNSCSHGWLHRPCLRGLAPPACTNLQSIKLKSNVRKKSYVIHLAARSGTGEREPSVKQSPFTADHELIQAVEKRSQPIFCSEDCVLFCQGDAANGLYFLRGGAATLTLKSDSGGVAMCFEVYGGSLLGLPPIIGNVPYSLAATAQQGSIVRYVTREDFEDLLREEPSLAISVFQVVAAEIAAARKALSEME